MNESSFQYCGYSVTITEHPIYNDFQFVVKTLDEKTVVGTNSHFLESREAAEIAARQLINDLK
jgi:hypothetical protein